MLVTPRDSRAVPRAVIAPGCRVQRAGLQEQLRGFRVPTQRGKADAGFPRSRTSLGLRHFGLQAAARLRRLRCRLRKCLYGLLDLPLLLQYQAGLTMTAELPQAAQLLVPGAALVIKAGGRRVLSQAEQEVTGALVLLRFLPGRRGLPAHPGTLEKLSRLRVSAGGKRRTGEPVKGSRALPEGFGLWMIAQRLPRSRGLFEPALVLCEAG